MASAFKVKRGRPATSGAPASVNAPVSGTDLTAVWNLQSSGTGPRTGPTHGTWAGSIDSYLTGKGFVVGNDNGATWVDIGSATVTISNYRFISCPRIQYRGTGTINFVDCDFDFTDTGAISGPRDVNGTPTGQTIAANFSYCRFNVTTTWHDTGTANFDHCRWSNQVQIIWGGNATILVQDSYITGGGCNPPAGSHVELIQYNSTTGTFTVQRCMFNFIDGQASLGVPGGGNYGWTGVFTCPSTGTMDLEDCIFEGITEIDDNPSNPDRIGGTIWYNAGATIAINNCVLESAQGAPGGYTGHAGGGPATVTNSGNRTFATNTALVTADFG